MNLVLPDFFILGEAKCGTTTLHSYLSRHPDIFLPAEKETHFFDRTSHFQQGIEWYSEYFFSGAGAFKAVGDATPAYFHLTDICLPRIHDVYRDKDVKFILVFRNPVDRAWSHYLHKKRNLDEELSFPEALAAESERLSADPLDWRGYFRDGLYAGNLKCWLNCFAENRFLYILSDDLEHDISQVLSRVYRFLDLDEPAGGEQSRPAVRENQAAMPRSLSLHRLIKKENLPGRILAPVLKKLIRDKKQRGKLKNFARNFNLRKLRHKPVLDAHIARELLAAYKNDILELETLIGRDLSAWIKKYEP